MSLVRTKVFERKYLKVLHDHDQMEFVLHFLDFLRHGLVIVDVVHSEVPQQLIRAQSLILPTASHIFRSGGKLVWVKHGVMLESDLSSNLLRRVIL